MKILSASFESPGMLSQKGPRALPPFFVLLLLSVTRGTFYLRAHLQMCQNNIYLPKSHFWCVLLLCPRLVKRGKRKVCTDPLFSPVLAVLRGGNRWQAGKGVACIRRIVIPFYFFKQRGFVYCKCLTPCSRSLKAAEENVFLSTVVSRVQPVIMGSRGKECSLWLWIALPKVKQVYVSNAEPLNLYVV